MPSCPLKTDHALWIYSVIFQHMLILGLYFCCNAKESRKSQNNVSQWIHLWSSWLAGVWLDSEFFKLLFIQGKFAEYAPPAPFKQPSASHSYSYTFRHFGDASCSHSIPQVTEQLCWNCLGLAAVPSGTLMIVVEGQETICHLWYPPRIFPAGSQILTGKTFSHKAHFSDPERGECYVFT